MKLIKPSEISARILTLLEESDERVIIVSPYMKISKWYKFMNKVNELKTRRIHIEIYVRDDPNNAATYRDLDQLALQYKKIPHLHSKLYLNERYGIVTSMNLLLSFEINSLEIGYAADLKEITHRIREELKRIVKNSWLWLAENALHISTGTNNYIVSINDGYLRVTASLRIDYETKQKIIQRSSLIVKKVGDLTAMKVDMHPGPEPDILQLSGQAQQIFKSTCITGILEDEAAYMMESVRRFIDNTDDIVIREALIAL